MNQNSQLSAIVAMGENRVIGIDNQLPWHLPADLKHFKSITTGHTIMMGRKTYESIGRPLPNRRNVILTRDKSYQVPGCEVVHDFKECLSEKEQVFVIGGAEVFQLVWPHITTLYLTLIHHNFKGDAYFPEFDLKDWQKLSQQDHQPDDQNAFAYSFVTLKKVKSSAL